MPASSVKEVKLARIQAICRGYLARKDIKAFRAAELSKSHQYYSRVVEELAC